MSRSLRTTSPLDASGRETEVGRLVQALEASRRLDAAPEVCFVWGPSGIGKSFLLDAFAREVRARGISLLSGAAARGCVRPFGLFADVLPRAIDLLSESGVSSRRAGELARRTIPVAGGAAARVTGDDEVTAQDRRLDLFEAVAEIFSLLGKANPPVIMLDDVDAADGASLDLLRYLLSVVAGPSACVPTDRNGGRALWVLTFRGDAAPQALEELVSRTPALTLPLASLDRAGLRAFLSHPSMVERILHTTGGVPERIEALLAAGPDLDVEDLVLRRMRDLTSVQRRVVTILAALGRPVEPRRVDTILQSWMGDGLGSSVDELVSLRIVGLRAGSFGPRLFLSRPLEGERLLGELSEAESKLLHSVIGKLLAKEEADPADVARHLRISDPRGEGFEWTVRAGEALAAKLAYGEAADAFEQALALLGPEDEGRAIPLYEWLCSLHSGLSDHPRALRWLGRLKRAHRGSEEKLRSVQARVARECLSMGRARLTVRICLDLLGLDESVRREKEAILGMAARLRWDDPLVPSVFADLVEAFWVLGRYDHALVLAEKGLEVLGGCERHTEHIVEFLSLRNTLGKLRLHRGEYDEAKAQFVASARDAARFELPRENARAVNNLGVVAHRQGNRPEALEHYRRSLVLRQTAGDRSREAFALQNIAALYHETGELEAALEHYHRALAAFTRSSNTAQVSRTAANLASLYLFLGDLDRAGSLYGHAQKAADEVRDPYLQGYASMIAADLELELKDTSAAKRFYRRALDLFGRIDSPRYTLETHLYLARIGCEEGDVPSAEGHLDRARALMDKREFVGLASIFNLVCGQLHLSTGDLTLAGECLVRARELLLETPDLESPVQLYHLMGRLCAKLGDESGADANHARAQRLLDELVVRVPKAHRDHFLALPRRRAVLEASSGPEITPARLRRALSLESGEPHGTARPKAAPGGCRGIIGRNEKLVKVLSLIDRVASVSQPVLIRGPSGTGKELVADAIHRSGPRKEKPFVKVNCAAMHEDLLLSELFGHEKGAFTGAHQTRKGRFELADGGTLFLDEIGDISAKVQVALLRVMQQQAFERVGGTRTLRVDVRVLCATNRNLEAMIASGSFREDLYYRLKGVMLEMPSLRERIDDLPELVEHFLQECACDRGEPKRQVTPEVMDTFTRYSWPGNIRELQQVIQSVSLFAEGNLIGMSDLEQYPELLGTRPPPPDGLESVSSLAAGDGGRDAPPPPVDLFELARSSGLSLKELKRQVEETCIRRALQEAQGNISEAARLLGMKRSRLSQIVNADDELKDLAAGR